MRAEAQELRAQALVAAATIKAYKEHTSTRRRSALAARSHYKVCVCVRVSSMYQRFFKKNPM